MVPLGRRIAEQLHGLNPGRRADHPQGLTGREVEVLRLVSGGYTNAEIGERLFISSETVARHVHNILDKTGMAKRTEATAFALRHGLAE